MRLPGLLWSGAVAEARIPNSVDTGLAARQLESISPQMKRGLTMSQFTPSELQSAIGTLKSVAEGPDDVHNEMIRHLPQCAQKKLLTTFNILWRRGEFPDAWRDAVVIPILKPGKSGLDPLHYRPISPTSALCKLMEKMVNARLTWFLEAQGLLSNDQCGFRKHRSSVDHVLTLDSIIRASWSKNRHVGAVFFDIEAAYDTAWRHGILLKIFKLGIRCSMATFLRNFLSDRSFRVRIGKDISDRYYPAYGIPQGGVLSPYSNYGQRYR